MSPSAVSSAAISVNGSFRRQIKTCSTDIFHTCTHLQKTIIECHVSCVKCFFLFSDQEISFSSSPSAVSKIDSLPQDVACGIGLVLVARLGPVWRRCRRGTWQHLLNTLRSRRSRHALATSTFTLHAGGGIRPFVLYFALGNINLHFVWQV